MSRYMFKIIFIVIVVLIAISQVYAATNDVGIVEIKSKVVSGFTGTISINYFDDKGYNILLKLDKVAGYKFKGKIPAGKYKLDSIDVVMGYKASINEAFEVKKDKVIALNLVLDKVVAKADSVKPSTKPVKTATKSAINKSIIKTPDKNLEISGKSINKVYNYKGEKANTKDIKKKEGFKVGNSGVFTIVILLLLIVSVVVIKFRKKNN